MLIFNWRRQVHIYFCFHCYVVFLVFFLTIHLPLPQFILYGINPEPKVPWKCALFSGLELLRFVFLAPISELHGGWKTLESLYSSFVCLLVVACEAGCWTASKVDDALEGGRQLSSCYRVGHSASIGFIHWVLHPFDKSVCCSEVWEPLL